MDKDIPIEQKLNLWQDEYFELLMNVINHNERLTYLNNPEKLS